ncbi:penicillin acylase family protein [bacterium]|nr:penicillin acylase family protein [bacterium]
MKISGLNSTARILRDRFGIPQIYASSQHDLFFAQGFVHAQDRFWQMDVWRHTGAGRLSEMFGKSQIDTDKFLRTLGWERIVREELNRTDATSMNILKSYAEGVNAYLKNRGASQISFEHVLLSMMNRNYKIENWEPLHSATFAKVMSWDLCENMFSEMNRSLLLKTLTMDQINELYPAYPENGPFVVSYAPGSNSPADLPIAILKDSKINESLQELNSSLENLPDVIGVRGESIGSNNWVISGSKTNTGKPILVNDPHLGVQMPSIWYEAGLHCEPVTDQCPFDVSGFSFAGVPGIILGHNSRIAWAMTNVGADVMDLYVEKVNPQNVNQYLYQNSWRDMNVIQDRIHVGGSDDAIFSIRSTHHGPVISDSMKSLNDFGNKTGQDVPKPYAIALRWTALDVSDTFPAIWKMNIAKNWEEFRAAASNFDVPSQNLLYADIDGNIGYQTPGMIPIRAKGDGRSPVPGWISDYEWTGYIPFNELPSVKNPEQDFIASANNQVISSLYPHLITNDWEAPFRAARITQLINENKKPVDENFIEAMQADNKNSKAEFLVPYLFNLEFQDARLQQALEILRSWNHQNSMDSSGAALFEMFWKYLLSQTFHDDLPEQFWPGGAERWGYVIQKLITVEKNHWWDNKKTSMVETRDDILQSAFKLAVQELQRLQGNDPDKWRWGSLHTVTFRNETLGESGIKIVEKILNRGPFESSGGTTIVNATSFNPLKSFAVTSLPSMRMIVDFSSLDQSMTVNSTGQSGHAYHPNYIDMADLWRNVQYHPWPFSKGTVEKQTTDTLVLSPRR